MFAQKEDYVWVLGKNAGINFNTGGAVAISTSVNGYEASASVCNASGQLQFYTEGSIVWNRNGGVMPNASLLMPANNTYSSTATSSTTQGAVIVPMPDSAGKYYLFSLTQQEELSRSGWLYYTVIDMQLNGGLGDVVIGRKAILLDTGLTEKMTAVVGDRCNIWLLVHARNSTLYKAYEITSSGINTSPVVSNVGVLGSATYTVGQIGASHDRKRVVACNVPQTGTGGIEMLDFNPATGVLTNAQKLGDGGYYGVAFSPDNTKLYVTGLPRFVYQYNLTAGNLTAIINSRYQIGAINAGYAGGLKLGPDGRIYCGGGGTVICTIDQPNQNAPACAYNTNGLTLITGTSEQLGMPSEVAVLRKDTITSSKAITACFKDSILLEASDAQGWGYLWDNSLGASRRWVYNSGTYIVNYHTPSCTYHIDTFIVRFSSPLPKVDFYSGCRSSANSLIWAMPKVGDATEYTYIWRDATAQTLQTHSRTGADTLYNPPPGVYTVNIKQSLGCDTTLSITLPPSSSHVSFTVDTIACTGDLLHFTNTSSADITNVGWNFGDSATSASFHDDHTYTKMGTYHVRLIGGPCIDTAYKTIVVEPTPAVKLPGDTLLCFGVRLQLQPLIQPGEYVGYNYQWTPGGDVTSNSTAYTTFKGAASQQIVFRVTTESGCTGADSMNITIHDRHFIKTGDTAICPGDTIQLNAHGVKEYHWIFDGMYISDTNIANPLVAPARDHIYTVWGKDSTCTDTAYAHVRVHPAAVIYLPETVSLYAGEQVEAPVQTNCAYLSWFPYLGLSNPNIANPIISPEVSTQYIIAGTTEAGCRVMDTMNVIVNDGSVLTLPNAFVPGIGPNGLLKPIYRGIVRLKSFTIYSRWGAKVYESSDINAGWDGSSNGVPQPEGVYIYVMEGVITGNKSIVRQGNVTLLR